MTLQLYGHPFAAFVWKPLIAAYERNVPFIFRMVDQDHTENAKWARRCGPKANKTLAALMRRKRRWTRPMPGCLTASARAGRMAAASAWPIAPLPPALFYGDWVHPIPDSPLKAYRTRLLKHPSVARVVDEARPYRHFFPLGAPERD